jgi:hypothetical protein
MGLQINGKQVLTSQFRSETGLATADYFADLFGMHPGRVSAVIALAFVRNRRTKSSAPKLYSVEKVADHLSQINGFKIEIHHLHELVKRTEGQEIMLARGVSRSRFSWRYWADRGVGPVPIKVGGTYRYLRSQCEAWARYMAATPEFHYLKAAERANSPVSDLIPATATMVGVSAQPGDEGGIAQFSCAESGG